jgi:hypothetical protein
MKRLMKKMQNFGLLDEHYDVADKGKNFRKDFEPARKLAAHIFEKYLSK